jgi:hypothetical protein
LASSDAAHDPSLRRAKSFARALPVQGSDINAGTINPHMTKKFFGSAKINEWLDQEPVGEGADDAR